MARPWCLHLKLHRDAIRRQQVASTWLASIRHAHACCITYAQILHCTARGDGDLSLGIISIRDSGRGERAKNRHRLLGELSGSGVSNILATILALS